MPAPKAPTLQSRVSLFSSSRAFRPLALACYASYSAYIRNARHSSTGKPDQMPPKHPTAPQIPVSDLRQTGATPFLLEPNAETRGALAEELNALSLRKVRFVGEITPHGRNAWQLKADLGATVVQSCIATLEPVTTRIDSEVSRRFVPAHKIVAPEAGTETEMTDEDDIEELGDAIDLDAILAEALSLAIPAYPRKEGAEVADAQFSAQGVAPMRDEDMRPFAGLTSLRDKMQKDGDES